MSQQPTDIDVLLMRARASAKLRAVPITGHAPCTPVEQGLWHDERVNRPAAYNLVMGLICAGAFSPNRLRAAVHALEARHAALSFIYPVSHNVLSRLRQTPKLATFDIIDVADEPDSNALEFISRPFDLERGPLARMLVLRSSPTLHKILLVCHHIIADARSLDILAHDLVDLYTAEASESQPELYSEFANTWLARLQREQNSLIDFWSGVLTAPLPKYAFPRAPEQGTQPQPEHEYFRQVDTYVFARAAEATGAGAFVTGLAAFAYALWSEFGIDDLLSGVPVDLGDIVSRKRAVGNFINTIPVRVRMSGVENFNDVVRSVRMAWDSAYDHRDIPLRTLVDSIGALRSGDNTSPTQLMFGWQKVDYKPRQVSEAIFRRIRIPRYSSVCSLSVEFIESDTGLVLSAEYDGYAVDRKVVVRLISAMIEIIQGAGGRLASRQRAVQLQSTVADTPDLSRPSVLERFIQYVMATPDQIAVISSSGERSYRQLFSASRAITDSLLELAARDGGIVRIQCGPLDSVVAAIFGTWMAGLTVLLEPSDAAPNERQALDQISTVGLIKIDPSGTVDIGRLNGEGLSRKVDPWKLGQFAFPAGGLAAADPTRWAYVVMTSGSTSLGRAVVVGHQALALSVAAWGQIFALADAARRHAQATRPSFDVFYGNILRALCFGGTLIECPAELRYDSDRLSEFLTRYHVDIIEIVPAITRSLLVSWRSGIQRPQLKIAIVGSDVWADQEFIGLAVALGPTCRLFNTYGLSEAAIDSLYFEYRGEIVMVGRTTLGEPMPGTVALIVDKELKPVADGASGELLITGDALTAEYLNDPQQTRQRFPEAEIDGRHRRVLRTGDKVRQIAGRLVFEGRLDNQFSVDGVRIEPEAIERVIINVSGVKNAAVVLARSYGERRVFTAFLETERNPDAVKVRVVARLREQLPAVMCPRVFIILPELPRLSNGKLDRHALESEPLNEHVDIEDRNGVVPMDSLEATIATMVEKVLSLSSPVKRLDDFFALGGSSLEGARVFFLLEREYKCSLQIRLLYGHSTIAEIAAMLRERIGKQGEADALPPTFVEDCGWKPLFETSPMHKAEADTVVLTGATGRIGSQILLDLLAHATCHVRIIGRKPVPNLGPHLASRCQFSTLDLATASMRLLTNTEWPKGSPIIHAACAVDFQSDYDILRPTNVHAVKRLLEEAMRRESPVHFLSSTSIEAFAATAAVRGGYNQTKWAAESCCRAAGAAGLPVTIYRISYVIDIAPRGAMPDDDLFWCFIKTCMQLGKAPDLDVIFDPVDVSSVSQAIMRRCRATASGGRTTVVRLVNPHPIDFSEIVKLLQKYGRIIWIPTQEWLQALLLQATAQSPIALAPFLKLFPDAEGVNNLFDTRPRLVDPPESVVQAEVATGAAELFSTRLSQLAKLGWLLN